MKSLKIRGIQECKLTDGHIFLAVGEAVYRVPHVGVGGDDDAVCH